MREIVFDTETTGTRTDLGHRIVEFGAVEIVDGVIGEGKQWYFNPERLVDAGAYEVHGLSDEFLSTKPLFRDCLAEILEFIASSPLIAHNANFDRNFLNNELRIADYPTLPGHRFIDTLKLSRQKFKSGRHTLDALCGRYDIDISDRTLHGALLDSKLLAMAYLRLSEGAQHSMVLVNEARSENNRSSSPKYQSKPRFSKRTVASVSLPCDIIAAHRAFVEQEIQSPLWESCFDETAEKSIN